MGKLRKAGSVRGYIATKGYGALIYCTNKQWYPERLVGPGGYCAKVYKTLGGAQASTPRQRSRQVHRGVTMTNQPTWKLVYATDERALYVDETGVYDPELVIAQEIFDAPKSARWEIFRFPVERCAIVAPDGPRGVKILTTAYIAGQYAINALPHPIGQYGEWFADDLAGVASSVSLTEDELIEDLCSEDPSTRAGAYEAIGGYHGFLNFDQEPRTISDRKMKAWPNV